MDDTIEKEVQLCVKNVKNTTSHRPLQVDGHLPGEISYITSHHCKTATEFLCVQSAEDVGVRQRNMFHKC